MNMSRRPSNRNQTTRRHAPFVQAPQIKTASKPKPDTQTRKAHHRWLVELTALPTAAGREGRVAEYIKDWVGKRPGLAIAADRHGNLSITRKGRRSAGKHVAAPIIIEAHMDHPAFVVHEVIDDKTLLAEFRGGV